jgi:hypothetical protein
MKIWGDIRCEAGKLKIEIGKWKLDGATQIAPFLFLGAEKEGLNAEAQRAQSSEEMRDLKDCSGHGDGGGVYVLPRSPRSAATKGVAAPVGMTAKSNREVTEAAAPEG